MENTNTKFEKFREQAQKGRKMSMSTISGGLDILV